VTTGVVVGGVVMIVTVAVMTVPAPVPAPEIVGMTSMTGIETEITTAETATES